MSTAALPAYLIVGEDQEKRERNRMRFINRLEEVGSLDFDCMVVDATTKFNAEEVVSALRICPAFSPYRLVVIDHVDAVGADDLKELVSYLESPCETSILLLTAAKLGKNTRLYKRIVSGGSAAVIACDLPKKYQLHTRVREMAPSYGITIDDEAAKLLVSMVGTSTTMIGTELERLALLQGRGAHITASVIDEQLTRSVQINPWDLIDKAFSGQSALALKDLEYLDEKQIAYVLMLVADRLRELMTALSLQESGQGSQIGQILNVEPWRIKKIQSQARLFTLGHLQQALQKTAEADRRIKSGYDKRATLVDLFVFVSNRHAASAPR